MILCITHSQDFYTIDLFFEYLNSKNISYFRLNSDQLNHSQKLSITHGSFSIADADGNRTESTDFTAVWHRKSWEIECPMDLDKDYQKIFISEYESLRANMYRMLDHLPWINPLENEKKADAHKMYQLQIAEKNGLKIPATLFSNDEDEILKFIKEKCNNKAIAKLHGTISRNMNGESLISTTIIDENNVEHLSDIMYCPMIFQPYIEKDYELRIVYIDGEYFTGKINNSKNTDWRIVRDDYFWSAYQLPRNIENYLTLMMNEMGLCFGAIDMIKGTDGEYYFLEVNPQGEWGMLQKELDFPIAERIADYLLKRIQTNEQ